MLKKIGNVAVATLIAAGLLVGAVQSAQAVADPDLAVSRVNYNATGADTAANRWQEAVYLRARADLPESLDISGWKVHDTFKNGEGEYGNSYTFPAGTKVKPGGLVVVSSSAGVNKTDPNATLAFYMDFKRGYNGHFWNNGGDTVFVDKANGDQVTSFTYDFDSGYYVR